MQVVNVTWEDTHRFDNSSGGRNISDFTLAVQVDGERGSQSELLPVMRQPNGANQILVIQVPLKQKNPQNFGFGGGPMMAMASLEMASMTRSASTEDAYITHGEAEGPYTEMDGIDIERDETLPIRVTVQYYKATDGEVSKADVDDLAAKIKNVEEKGDFEGSLVTDRDQDRPTAVPGFNEEPTTFWEDWHNKHQREGESPPPAGIVADPSVPDPQPEPLPEGGIGF